MFTTRSFTRLASQATRASSRNFTTTGRAFVRVGDSIPDMTCLAEGSPGNKVNMAEEVGSGKALIIGVPAAFSEFLRIFSDAFFV